MEKLDISIKAAMLLVLCFIAYKVNQIRVDVDDIYIPSTVDARISNNYPIAVKVELEKDFTGKDVPLPVRVENFYEIPLR